MLDPRRLLSFAVFARHLSFTHAAKALHLTQPALHMQVRQLEDEAGAPLYRRVGGRLELTRAGQRLALLGLRLEEQLALAEQELRGEPASLPVTLSAGEGALLHLLPRGIRAWQALGMGPLRLLTHGREAAFKALLEGAAHLAVTSVESLPEAPLCWLRLAEVAQCLAVPKTHRLAGRRSVRLAELAGEALILPPPGSPLRTGIDAALPGAEVVVEARGWQVMLSCVAWGMGAAVVNAFNLPPKGVVLVPLKDLPARRYGCVWHASLEGEPRVAALRQALRDHLP